MPNNKKKDDTENLSPEFQYENLNEDKAKIMKEQKGKPGIYCLINKTTGHAYVGSSINIAKRISNYLSPAYLNSRKNNNMPIHRALLKYGYSDFKLLILKSPSGYSNLCERETSIIAQVDPTYNVLKTGYSSQGYLHTEETKAKLSEMAKKRVHTEETKAKISDAQMGERNPFYNKRHTEETKLKMSEAKSNYPVYVFDSYKKFLIKFASVTHLAKLIKANNSSIVDAINTGTLFRGEWYFTSMPLTSLDQNTPIITDLNTKEYEELISNMKNSKIKKAIFVYDLNKNFIAKYDGVMAAAKALHISHNKVSSCAKVSGEYGGYIFRHERYAEKDG